MVDHSEAPVAIEQIAVPEPTAVGRINFLDPTVPFGEGIKTVVSSIAIEQEGGSLVVDPDHLDGAVAHTLQLARQGVSEAEPVGDTDPDNPLEYSEREQTILAKWAVEDAGRIAAKAAERAESEGAEGKSADQADTRRSKVAVGIATFVTGTGGGLAAETATVLAQPVAGASGAKQACIQKLSKPPHGAHGKMIHPGTLYQETLVRAKYGGVEGCDNWQRVAKYRDQLKRNGHWINPVNPIWYSAEFPTSHSNDPHSLTITDFATTDSIDNCVGGHREPARVELRSFVRNAATGKIAARGKIKFAPIHIPGGC